MYKGDFFEKQKKYINKNMLYCSYYNDRYNFFNERK